MRMHTHTPRYSLCFSPRASFRLCGRRCGNSSWDFTPGTAQPKRGRTSSEGRRELEPCPNPVLNLISHQYVSYPGGSDHSLHVTLFLQRRVFQDEGPVEINQRRARDEKLPPPGIPQPDWSVHISISSWSKFVSSSESTSVT